VGHLPDPFGNGGGTGRNANPFLHEAVHGAVSELIDGKRPFVNMLERGFTRLRKMCIYQGNGLVSFLGWRLVSQDSVVIKVRW